MILYDTQGRRVPLGRPARFAHHAPASQPMLDLFTPKWAAKRVRIGSKFEPNHTRNRWDLRRLPEYTPTPSITLCEVGHFWRRAPTHRLFPTLESMEMFIWMIR